jgi:hypothetical protein
MVRNQARDSLKVKTPPLHPFTGTVRPFPIFPHFPAQTQACAQLRECIGPLRGMARICFDPEPGLLWR